MTDTNEGYAYDITGYPAITLSQYGYSDTGTAAESYTAILESYGIDNNNEDSDQEAQQREEFHPVSPMKSLELTKNWHAEFQSLLKLEDSAQKYMQLSRLARDFVYASKLYAKIIISELYLPEQLRTIKPVTSVLRGIAGGEKYICQNILFKFALDTKGLYGGDQNAMKSAGHDLKGSLMYYNCHIPKLNVPLMCLIDYRGFRVVAMSLLPVNKNTIVYGSADGGKTVHNSDPELNEKMIQAANMLNLKGHIVGSVLIHSAADIEGHKGEDGEYYLLDFARVVPPQAKIGSSDRPSHLYELLRPELVRSNPVPLSSDALTRMGRNDPNRKIHNEDVIKATTRLFEEVIPKFAAMLDEKKEPIYASVMLIQALHASGINCRHLGLVRSRITKNESARVALLTEMLARVLKDDTKVQLRKTMQAIRVPSEQPYRIVVADYLNSVFVLNESFWTSTVKNALRRKFLGALNEAEMGPSFNIREHVDMRNLLQRYQDLTGIKILPDSLSVLVYGTSTIDDSDIAMKVVVKNMNITAHAAAAALSRKAIAAEGTEAIHLFRRSIEQFKAAVTSSSNSAVTYLEWAKTLSAMARKFMLQIRWQAIAMYKSAIEKVERAIAIDPSMTEAHLFLCETIVNFSTFDYRLWTLHHNANYVQATKTVMNDFERAAAALDTVVATKGKQGLNPLKSTIKNPEFSVDKLLALCQIAILMKSEGKKFLVRAIQSQAKSLDSITLSDASFVTPEAIVTLLKKCSSLTSLAINSALSLDDGSVSKLLVSSSLCELTIASCRKVRCLPRNTNLQSTLTCLKMLDTGIDDNSLDFISSMYTGIQVLHLSGNLQLTHAGLVKIGSKLTLLKELCIGTYPDKMGSQVYCNGVTKEFLDTEMPHLELLDLSGTKITVAQQSALFSSRGDAPFSSIAKFAPNITTLSLSHSIVTSASLKIILKKCNKLEFVNLEACFNITSTAIKMLGTYCPNLRIVNLNGCKLGDNIDLKPLFDCSNLQHLFLSYLQITATSFQFMENTPNIFTSLQTLNLFSCGTVDEQTIKYFAPKVPNLRSLNLALNPRVTLKGLELIKKHCTNLHKLRMSECPFILSVSNIVPALPNLEVLDIAYCSRSIADDSLDAIGQYCPNIEDLDISGAIRITPEGLQRLLQRAKKLKRVAIRKCQQINADFLITRLRHTNSNVRIILDNMTKQTFTAHKMWDMIN